MLPMSQLQAFSVARRLVMFSDVISTCRGGESLNGREATHTRWGFRRTHGGGGLIGEQDPDGPGAFLAAESATSRQETTHQDT